MTRWLFLLLALSALSLSAPIDYEESAKSFYGQIFELYENESHEELFELLWSKWHSFVPKLFTDEEKAEMKKDFIRLCKKENLEEDSNFDSATIIARIGEDLRERLTVLTPAAKHFIHSEVPQIVKALRNRKEVSKKEVLNMFTALHYKFEALPKNAKASLNSAFPAFSKFAEIRALIDIGEEIFSHMIGICKKVSGYGYCEELLALFPSAGRKEIMQPKQIQRLHRGWAPLKHRAPMVMGSLQYRGPPMAWKPLKQKGPMGMGPLNYRAPMVFAPVKQV